MSAGEQEALVHEEIAITREQAEAFFATLWPCGPMCHLDSPTRTFLSAFVGKVPQSLPYDFAHKDMARMKTIASVLRGVADHLEVSSREADRTIAEASS